MVQGITEIKMEETVGDLSLHCNALLGKLHNLRNGEYFLKYMDQLRTKVK